jgi:hypothetical protein
VVLGVGALSIDLGEFDKAVESHYAILFVNLEIFPKGCLVSC